MDAEASHVDFTFARTLVRFDFSRTTPGLTRLRALRPVHQGKVQPL
jgi:hypothetical protein